MNLKNTFIFLFSFAVMHITAQNAMILLTQQKEFVAGSTITLSFHTNGSENYKMYCTNSYGTTLISSSIENSKLTFKIPNYISNKIGLLTWKVIGIKDTISGQLKIIPKENPVTMETYLGPPSIEAGGTDFTMLVVIPTDNLDNPIQQNTAVTVKHQFLSSEKQRPVFTKNLIAYKRIFSPVKSGRMILSTESLDLNSKEYDVNIMPAIGQDFEIFSKSNHKYADGNQITTFFTSTIKDKNNNVISDGSFVDFFITNKKGNILKTSGTTINGIATAKMIHPEWAENWKIKAYITGIAESNILEVLYEKVIKDFTALFSKNNRKLKIGPLKSFMNQMIPDGLQVKLSVFKNGELQNDIIKKSKDGFVIFDLDSNIYENGNYNLKITTAGVTKTFQSKKLW